MEVSPQTPTSTAVNQLGSLVMANNEGFTAVYTDREWVITAIINGVRRIFRGENWDIVIQQLREAKEAVKAA